MKLLVAGAINLKIPKTKIQVSSRKIIQALKEEYPEAHCALDHKNPFELLVATVLSAQCTDERVNIVTKVLFEEYPDPQSLAKAPVKKIEKIIYSTGFYSAKAKNIISLSKSLIKDHGGLVPKEVESLTALAGVGRKTANVVLGNAFGIVSGIVVDTHVRRLSQRLGLSRENSPEKIEQDLMKLVEKEDWIQFSHWLISHGRKICAARTPKCQSCVLNSSCPSRTDAF